MSFSVGKKLREARKARNHTIAEVSMTTRISKDFIEALEDERYDVFPAKVYLLSFLRKYSDFLELDTDAIIHRVRNEYEPEKSKVLNTKSPVEKLEKTGNNKNNTRIVLTVLVLLVIAAIGTIGVSYYRKLNPGSVVNEEEANIDGALTGYIGRGIEVIVEVRKDTWVKTTCDGAPAIEKVLPAGFKGKLSAEQELIVRIGNVHGIILSHGGQEIDIISGNKGYVNEIVFRYYQENNEVRVGRWGEPGSKKTTK